MNFTRIKIILRNFDVQPVAETELAKQLREYVEQNDRTLRPSRKLTVNGIAPLAWREG